MFTKLYSKYVRSVIRFDEHNLILVGEVEWFAIIRSDREVERGSVNLRDRRELGNARILLGNQFCPPESELGIVDNASRNKDRAIVDGNGNDIFCVTEWVAPEWRWEKSVANELGVLDLVQ